MVLGHPSRRALSTPLITSSRISAQQTNHHSLPREQCGRGMTMSRTTTRVANELSPPKSACDGDAVLRTSTRGTVHMGQCAGLPRTCATRDDKQRTMWTSLPITHWYAGRGRLCERRRGTWALAEIGPWATNCALNNSQHVPFLQHELFNRELLSHILTLRRGSSDFVRAHRLCAGLSSYMLFPYILVILLALSLISTMLTLLASQIYPLLLLIFSLFTAASTSPKHTFYSTEIEKQDVKQNVTMTTEDNTLQMPVDIERHSIVDIP